MLPRDDFSVVEEAIQTNSSRGVKIRLIVHDLTPSVRKLLKNVEVFREKTVPSTNCGIVLIDDKKPIQLDTLKAFAQGPIGQHAKTAIQA